MGRLLPGERTDSRGRIVGRPYGGRLDVPSRHATPRQRATYRRNVARAVKRYSIPARKQQARSERAAPRPVARPKAPPRPAANIPIVGAAVRSVHLHFPTAHEPRAVIYSPLTPAANRGVRVVKPPKVIDSGNVRIKGQGPDLGDKIANAAADAAKFLTQNNTPDALRPSLPPAVTAALGKAERDAAQAGAKIAKIAKGAIAPDRGAATAGLQDPAVKFANDALDIAGQAPASAVRAATQIASGHGEKFAKEMAQQYVNLAQHPIRSFQQHPAGSLLLLGGVEGAIGRAAGAAGRAAGADWASITRTPLRYPDTGIEIPRTYKAQVTRKAVQVAHENVARRAAAALDQHAQKLAQTGRLADAAKVRARALRIAPDVAKPRHLRRLVNDTEGTAQMMMAAGREESVAAASKAVRKAKLGNRSAVVATARGAVAPTKQDMTAYLAEIDSGLKALGPAQRARAEVTVRRLRADLARGIDETAIRSAHRALGDVIRPLQQEAVRRGLLDAEQAQAAELIPFAARKMGARHEGGRMVINGTPLDYPAVRRAVTQAGHEAPVMLSESPRAASSGAFYRHYTSPAPLTRGPKTGTATVHGTGSASPQVAAAQAARLRVAVENDRGYEAFINTHAVQHGGKIQTFTGHREAQAAADDAATTGKAYAVVRLKPRWAEQRQAAARNAHQVEQQTQATLADAVSPTGPDRGRYVLVPAESAAQLAAHVKVLAPGRGLRGLRSVRSFFARNVLSTSPKYPVGNLGDSGFRAVTRGTGPLSALQDVRIRRNLQHNPEALARYIQSANPGGQIRSIELRPRDALETATLPLSATQKLMMHAMSTLTEKLPQRLFGGKEAMRLFASDMGPIARLSGRGAKQAAAELERNPTAALELGRQTMRAYGRYSSFGPAARQAVMYLTPFAPAFVNSVVYMLRTMPADSPVATSLFAAAAQVTSDYRKTIGQVPGLDGHTTVPDFLRGAIRNKDGSWNPLPIVVGSAYGVQGLPSYAGNLVLPEFSSSFEALKGQDWKGRKLKDQSAANRVEEALKAFAGVSSPIGRVKSVAEQGPSALNPIRPIKTAKKHKRRARRRPAPPRGFQRAPAGWTPGGGKAPADSGFQHAPPGWTPSGMP